MTRTTRKPTLKKGGRIPKVIASVNWIFRPSSKENKQKGGRGVAKTGGIGVFVYVSENFAPPFPARATQGTVKGGAGPPIHPTSSRQAGWGNPLELEEDRSLAAARIFAN